MAACVLVTVSVPRAAASFESESSTLLSPSRRPATYSLRASQTCELILGTYVHAKFMFVGDKAAPLNLSDIMSGSK